MTKFVDFIKTDYFQSPPPPSHDNVIMDSPLKYCKLKIPHCDLFVHPSVRLTDRSTDRIKQTDRQMDEGLNVVELIGAWLKAAPEIERSKMGRPRERNTER